jgi:transposase InsO family protein
MPFRESSPVEERVALMQAYDTGAFTVLELCHRFGVSRQTFYVLRQRRESGEARWFEERSRAPKSTPHGTPDEVRAKVIAMRQRFSRFGPKKIRACLIAEHPAVRWPAASTIGALLKAEGLVAAKKRRRRPLECAGIAAGSDTANGEWAMDFKGWFRTRDGRRCDPLTVSDTASRYLVEARITAPTHEGVKAVLTRVFSDIGLPEAIRCDNGPPFGSAGAGGLSRLSVWFLKLGIEPRYIPPSSPQDNGRHERMHRTLKAETAYPPADDWTQQQIRFDAFRRHYNEERPHEALGQSTPASRWMPPGRPMPARIEEPWYDPDHQVRRVRPSGEIRWRGEYVFLSETLAHETVGLAEIDLGLYIVRFCGRDLGLIDRAGRFRRFAPPRARLRKAREPTME